MTYQNVYTTLAEATARSLASRLPAVAENNALVAIATLVATNVKNVDNRKEKVKKVAKMQPSFSYIIQKIFASVKKHAN